MKVGFITADWSDIPDPDTGHPTLGGAGWYRSGLPAKYLQRNGIETIVCELISVSNGEIWLHDWDENIHDDCDVVVVQRWMDHRAEGVIRAGRANGQVVVNDVDDWYWGLDRRNQAFAAVDPKNNPKVNKDHYKKSLAASDCITVSTPYLADRLGGMIDTPIEVVRNGIDLERWGPSEPLRAPETTIGWVGATSHRSGDLETLRGVLGPFCERNACWFLHSGYWDHNPHAGELAEVDSDFWLDEPLTDILNYPSLFKMDVGIVPLNDVPFNMAKSAIKGMEYAAASVPFVAARTPEYMSLEREFGVGLTAKNPAQWKSHMKKLLDPGFRDQERKRNLEAVAQLDMAIVWKNWADFYASLV